MPISVPVIDGRSYEELRDEALRRIPVHNPQWTNFNASDPGVTLIELFAFMTESLLYRANQVPERNRLAFLALLGIGLRPAAPARGIVQVLNERGRNEALALWPGLEVAAGEVTFRTDLGIDVLPVDAVAYVKRRSTADEATVERYRRLYASFAGSGRSSADVTLYDTVALTPDGGGVDLVSDTVDGSLWVALLVRPGDMQGYTPREAQARARSRIAGRILSLGIVPRVDAGTAVLARTPAGDAAGNHLAYRIPAPPDDGMLPVRAEGRVARYRPLEATPRTNVLVEPGVVELTLPDESRLGLWDNLDPLESGVGDFPPSLDDTAVRDRLVTWIRVSATSAQPAGILWAGINAATVTQRVPIDDEVLPDGSGDPDQVVRLARRPVVPGSVRLSVAVDGPPREWAEVPDLLRAAPEVGRVDHAMPPGRSPSILGSAEAFVLDAEAGELRFGDGEHGRRPPRGARMVASYDTSDGTAGNVGPGAISASAALPAGLSVRNPVRTWGGVDAEAVVDGERRVTGFLQHGDRLVTAEDHRTLAAATPEVEVGRVEALPAFDPRLARSDPGDTPGSVTLLVVPRYDLVRPEAPSPDRYFLDAVCRFLEPRRIVTAELILRGPSYVPVWLSVGLEVMPGAGVADTREAVKRALQAFLSPLPRPASPGVPVYAHADRGWPLASAVRDLELAAYIGRVAGVRLVRGVLIGSGGTTPVREIELRGLELPRLAGISVVAGDPAPLSDLQPAAIEPPPLLPVPSAPEAC